MKVYVAVENAVEEGAVLGVFATYEEALYCDHDRPRVYEFELGVKASPSVYVPEERDSMVEMMQVIGHINSGSFRRRTDQSKEPK